MMNVTSARRLLLLAVGSVALAGAAAGEAEPPPRRAPAAAYFNNFLKAETGKVPADFMVLAGNFVVKEEPDGNKMLELPGEPLEHFGLLFGPGEHDQVRVSADIWGDVTGRRFPEFGVGAGDLGGYKLWLVPGQKLLELRKGEDVVATVPYPSWKPQTWTFMRLTVRRAGGGATGGTRVEGYVAQDGATPEAAATEIAFDDTEAPPTGRASVWGTPFSGRPIRFDNLTVRVGDAAAK